MTVGQQFDGLISKKTKETQMSVNMKTRLFERLKHAVKSSDERSKPKPEELSEPQLRFVAGGVMTDIPRGSR
jgi:hypothetical protein